MGNQIFDEKSPVQIAATFEAANTTTWQNVEVRGGYLPWRIDALWAVSTDTVDVVVEVATSASNPGSSSYTLLGAVKVPAGAGTNEVPPVDILAAIIPTGYAGFILFASDYIYAHCVAAVSADKRVSILGYGGEL